MIASYFKNRRRQRSENFIKSIGSYSDDDLKGAYSMLDMEKQLHPKEYTNKELNAVEEELNKRGYKHMEDY